MHHGRCLATSRSAGFTLQLCGCNPVSAYHLSDDGSTERVAAWMQPAAKRGKAAAKAAPKAAAPAKGRGKAKAEVEPEKPKAKRGRPKKVVEPEPEEEDEEEPVDDEAEQVGIGKTCAKTVKAQALRRARLQHVRQHHLRRVYAPLGR